ncbi:MAG: SMC family ATPase [Candidatus Gracilibacteria bacterium]|nr:SMC family ATPase [Candidatus Gracilibacteria bacterium]
MKLKSLKLLNFRKFKEEKIDFSQDFLVVFGKNGAGKSTLFDAIGYALFGAKSKDFLRGNKSELRSYFAGEKESCKIALEFEIGGVDYRVVRVIEKGIKVFYSEFIPETKDEISSNTGEKILEKIDDYIEKLLGIGRDTFLKTVFTKQKDLEILSSGNESDRRKIIHNILGIDKIEASKWDIKRDINSENILIKKVKTDIGEVDIEELNNQNKVYLKQIEEQNKLIKNHEKIELEENKKFEKIKEKYNKIEKKRDDYLALEKRLSNNQTNLENIKINFKNNLEKQEELIKKQELFDEKKGIFNDFEKLEKEFLILKENKIKLDNKIKLENEIKALEKKILGIKSEEKKIFLEFKIENYDNFLEIKNKLNLDLEKLEKNNKEIVNKMANFKAKLEQIKKKADELKGQKLNIEKLKEKGECPTCFRPLGEYADNVINGYEELLNKQRIEYKNILEEVKKTEIEEVENSKSILENKKKLEKIEIFDKKLLQIRTNLENFNKNLDKNKGELSSYKNINFDEKKFDEIKKKYEELKIEVNKLKILEGEIKILPEIIENIAKNKENINKIEIEKKEIINKIKKLNYSEEEYVKNKQEKEIFSEKIALIKEEKAGLINEKTKIIGEQNLILERINNYEKLKKDFEEKEKNIVYLELKFKILGDYILYLLENLKPRIEALASVYFSKITKGKYVNISLTTDYKIEIEGKGLHMFSGGEKDLANLCLRLSLAQNMSNLTSKKAINFLILDEILGSQDNERREEILANLKGLEEIFSQIILISHVDDIKDYASNLIEVKNVSKNRSEIISI